MVPINEVFDILPLSGYLEPGEVEQVEFVYNAFGGLVCGLNMNFNTFCCFLTWAGVRVTWAGATAFRFVVLTTCDEL